MCNTTTLCVTLNFESNTMEKKKNDLISSEHQSKGFENLSATMAPFVKKLLGAKGMAEVEILSNWKDIVGEDLAKYSLPQRIEFKAGTRNNGTLHLMAASGGFAMEIQHRATLILEKINTFFGYQAVSRLKLIQNDGFINPEITAKHEDNLEKKLVTEEEQNYIDNITEDIQHEELKNNLKKLGESIFSAKK